jgi:hypothetical protein
MATTTTNFGWTVPSDTDLVKDGAAAIRTALGGVDTSFVDLKGGTTGQILSKASGTDLDYTWVNPTTGDITGVTAGTGISGGGTGGDVTITNSMATAIDAKGDLIAGTGADAFSRLAVGTNGQILVADSTTATGLKWNTPAASSSGLVFLNRTTFSGVSSQTFDSGMTSTYKQFVVIFEKIRSSAVSELQVQLRYSGTTVTSDYRGSRIMSTTTTQAATGTSFTGSQATLSTIQGGAGFQSYFSGTMYLNGFNDTDYYGQGGYGQLNISDPSGGLCNFGFLTESQQAYNGFLLKASSGTITGAVSIYGLAVA